MAFLKATNNQKIYFGWLMTFKLILVSENDMFWCSKSENAYENQVYVAQIVCKNITSLLFNMVREWRCSTPVAS